MVWVIKPRTAGPHVTLRGVVGLMRPVPLAVWSVPTVTFGFLSQPFWTRNWGYALALAVLGAMVLQGLITHGLNDLYDWQSGTDQESPGVISGGSKVLLHGSLDSVGIWRIVWASIGIYVALAVGLAMYRGEAVLVWAGLGLAGSIVYSVPPMRLSYRPGLGEWIALFPAMLSGVLLGALAANPVLSFGAIVAATWYGVFCVASVMQHHFSDIGADWASNPQKRTTPAYWHMALGRTPKEPVVTYEVMALAIAGLGAVRDFSFFSPLIGATLLEVAFTVWTRLDGGIGHLTRMDLAIKALVPLAVVAVAIGRFGV